MIFWFVASKLGEAWPKIRTHKKSFKCNYFATFANISKLLMSGNAIESAFFFVFTKIWSLLTKYFLRWLDGDTSFLFILSGISGSALSCLGSGDDTGLSHQGVGQGGLAVVHVGNHGHVSDVPLLVHAFSHLVYCEVHLIINTMISL